MMAAYEEPIPWWHLALHYWVLVIVVGLVAWTLGLSLRRAGGTPPIPARPEPRRAGRNALSHGISNSRYSDFERRVFDEIAETDRRSFIVDVGFEIVLLHAVKDGLLKRVEPQPVPIHLGEPTHHKYEVTDAGLNFVSRYARAKAYREVRT